MAPILSLNPNHGDVGREVKRILGGPGADVCFECSGQAGGIGLAMHCGTPFPKVIAVGMYDGPADDLYLGEKSSAAVPGRSSIRAAAATGFLPRTRTAASTTAAGTSSACTM